VEPAGTSVTSHKGLASHPAIREPHLKQLEAENARLREAVADLTLDKQVLAEAAWGNYFFSIRGVPCVHTADPCSKVQRR
jgi:hypothetical protein